MAAVLLYSVIADRATDSANDEQLAILICFVDSCTPQEKFLGFHQCTLSINGEAIACDILQQHTSWNLDLKFL